MQTDYPVFRVRQALKIALRSNDDYLNMKDVDWLAVEATINAILLGSVPAAQLPTTQQIEEDALINAPRIVLDEHVNRGRRSERNYLVAFPGQSQELGEWFSKFDLRNAFPKTWKEMIRAWKQQQGAPQRSNGEITGDTLAEIAANVEAEAAAAREAEAVHANTGAVPGEGEYGDVHHHYEHQASVIEGRIDDGFDQQEHHQDQDFLLPDDPPMLDSLSDDAPQHAQQQGTRQDTGQGEQEQQQSRGSPTRLQLRGAVGAARQEPIDVAAAAAAPSEGAPPDPAPVQSYRPLPQAFYRGNPSAAAPAAPTNFRGGAPEFDPEAMQLRPLPTATNGLTRGLSPFLQFLPRDIPPGQIPSVAPPPPSLSHPPPSLPNSGSTRPPAAASPARKLTDLLIGNGGARGSPGNRPGNRAQTAPLAQTAAAGTSVAAMLGRMPRERLSGVHPLLQANMEYAQGYAPMPEIKREYQMAGDARFNAAGRAGGVMGQSTAYPPAQQQQRGVTGRDLQAYLPAAQQRAASVLSSGRKRRQLIVGPSRTPRPRQTATPELAGAAAAAGGGEEIQAPMSTCKRLKLTPTLSETPMVPVAMGVAPQSGGGGGGQEAAGAMLGGRSTVLGMVSPVKPAEPHPEGQEPEVVELASDADEDLTAEERAERKKVDRYLRADKWRDARITGAKNQGQGVQLWVTWADGFKSIVPSKKLQGHDRWHCMASLIEFYESKTRKKSNREKEKSKGKDKSKTTVKEEDGGEAVDKEEGGAGGTPEKSDKDNNNNKKKEQGRGDGGGAGKDLGRRKRKWMTKQ